MQGKLDIFFYCNASRIIESCMYLGDHRTRECFPDFGHLRIHFNSNQSLRASPFLIRTVCVPNTRGLSATVREDTVN